MDHGSLAFIHIKIFLQCGQCQAGESKTEDATLMVFLVKKPLIPVFFFSSSLFFSLYNMQYSQKKAFNNIVYILNCFS